MYLGRFVKSFHAEDDATLVVPRAQANAPSQEVKAVSSVSPRVVVVEKIVEKIVEKPIMVDRVVEVEKIVEVPVAASTQPSSNFFPDHLPDGWAEQTAVSAPQESVSS